jgi:hypothetical protein
MPTFSRRLFFRSTGATVAAAGLTHSGQANAAPATADRGDRDNSHFQSDGGINDAYLVNQLNGNSQSIADLAFITSLTDGNLELLAQGGSGTFLKLNYLDASSAERTGIAIMTGSSTPIISIAPEANGDASLDLENNDLTGVITVVPSPDNNGQLSLDGLLALTPQSTPATPSSGGVLYVDSADNNLKFIGSSGTVTVLAGP